jgi:Ca2+-binding RTX toxin-like protein
MFWKNWLKALRVRLPQSGVSLRGSSAKRKSRLPAVGGAEGLELRTLLSVNAVFDASTHELHVSSTKSDAMTLGVDKHGDVTVNGKTLHDHNHKHGKDGGFASSQIESIVIDGGSGNNKIDLRSVSAQKFSAVKSVTINGGGGNDSITGSQFDDTINGGSGNDQINGGDGNDLINGESGDDNISGGTGDDSLTGGDGNDTEDGGDGNDSIQGGVGDDILTGGTGTDDIQGQDGNDTMHGDANDTEDGGSGNNTEDHSGSSGSKDNAAYFVSLATEKRNT